MPKGKKNVGTAPGGTTFVRPGRLPRPQLQQPSQRCTPPGGGTGSAPPGVRTEHLNPRSMTDKVPAQRGARRRATYKKRPQPYESDCGAHGAPSEEEKSFGLRGGCKDGCGGENSRDSCRAERGESKPAGNQRPEAAAAGACPVAGAAGAAGVSTSSAGPSAAESFVAESSAAVGASKRGTPSM